jgi:hypothetical protein
MRGHVFENGCFSGLRYQFKCAPEGGWDQLTRGGHHSFGVFLLDVGQSMDILGGVYVIWGNPQSLTPKVPESLLLKILYKFKSCGESDIFVSSLIKLKFTEKFLSPTSHFVL